MSSWDNLPHIILQQIYKCLPLYSRLEASVVCSHWRHILFSPDLWRKQMYVLDNDKALRRLQFFCESGYIEFSKEVILIWPATLTCRSSRRQQLKEEIETGLLKCLNVLEEMHCIEKFIFKVEMKKNSSNLTSCEFVPHSMQNANKFHTSLCNLTRNNANLKYLSYGCSPCNIRPRYILENLNDCCLEQLTDFHVESICENHSSSVILDYLVTGYKVQNFSNLQHLSIDWHDVTPAFLNAFNSRKGRTSLLKLSLFVLSHQCVSDISSHPNADAWKLFSQKNSAVKVSLIFLYEVTGVCSELEHVYPVFMLKFLECDRICEVGYGNLIMWHKDTIRAHVMISTSNCFYELDNGHVLWMYLRGCTLRYITVIGYFIYEDIVKLIAASFSPHLEVFHIPKNQILTSAEASHFMVPISGTKVNELSRSVETILRHSWRPLRRHPLKTNFFSDACDDEFYLKPAPQDMLY